MILLSCSNCSYNGLQYGSIGLSVGYCVQHLVVLRCADETTCPRHLRKDLDAESREQEQVQHRKNFTHDVVQFIASEQPAEAPDAIDHDPSPLEEDLVGEAVTNWGFLGTNGTKIASLAQLHSIPGVRAELAMLSLGRAYVRTCLRNKGPWTSGFHIFWWTRRRLWEDPRIQVTDLRYQRSAVSMRRQFELATWSILMLRLQLISDVGRVAPETDDLSALSAVQERAAEAVQTPDPASLAAWLQSEGDALLAKAMPYERYRAMRASLHKEEAEDADDG